MSDINLCFLVNQSYAGISGLTRYDRGLLQAMASFSNLHVKPVELGIDPLPHWAVNLASRTGLGLGQFIRYYPIVWPKDCQGLVHLPQRGQASLLWNKGQRRVIVTVHDIIHYLHRSQIGMHIYRHVIQKWFDLFSVRLLKRADRVLASSEYTRQTLIDYAGLSSEKVQVVYLGVEQEHFRPLEIPEEFYQKYYLNRGGRYILHISSEEARKNVGTLIRAFARVYAQYQDVTLLKIGRPLYPFQRQANLRLIGELGLEQAVTFVDYVPDEDLPLFYNAAEVTLLPSIAEGFGFPVIESMACGTPVVCSNTSSLPELAGDAALLVAPRNVEGIACAILNILDDSSLSQQLQERSLQWVRKFTWEATAKGTVEAYRKVFGQLS